MSLPMHAKRMIVGVFLLVPLAGCTLPEKPRLSRAERRLLRQISLSEITVEVVRGEDRRQEAELIEHSRKTRLFRDINYSARLAAPPDLSVEVSYEVIKPFWGVTRDGEPISNDGLLCTWEPMMQVLTLYLVPLICSTVAEYTLTFRKPGGRRKVVITADHDALQVTGWIPIFTHAIPAAVASLWSDSLLDEVQLKIVQRKRELAALAR